VLLADGRLLQPRLLASAAMYSSTDLGALSFIPLILCFGMGLFSPLAITSSAKCSASSSSGAELRELNLDAPLSRLSRREGRAVAPGGLGVSPQLAVA
jgi:hypothetical protein